MEEIYEKIINQVKHCAEKKEFFRMPLLKDYEITEVDNPLRGSQLLNTTYSVRNENQIIEIQQQSKDMCRTFQIRPDRNIVNVSWKINDSIEKEFSQTWDDAI